MLFRSSLSLTQVACSIAKTILMVYNSLMAESGENFRSGGAVGMTPLETGHSTIDGQGGVIRVRGPRLNENSDTPGNTQEPRGKGQGGNEGNGVNGDAIKKKAIELAAQFPQTIGEELATALLTAYPDGTALNLIRRAGVTNKPVIAQLQTEIAEDVAATFATSDQARSLLAEKRRRMRKTVADVAAAKGVLGEDIKDDLVGPEGGYDGEIGRAHV